jgi:hypothetical protein
MPPQDRITHTTEPEVHIDSNHPYSDIQDTQALLTLQHGRSQVPGDTATRYLPAMHLTQSETRPHDLAIRGKSGHESIVAAINPAPGENLSDLIKRLHPDLSSAQVDREVRHVLQYNKAYGHDLGNGAHLDPTKSVYLTSIKYFDENGRVNKVESPTGKLTEIGYDSKGVAGYRITSPNGTIEEQASKDAAGKWTMILANGHAQGISHVIVDPEGNLVAIDQAGNKLSHLTRGDDVYMQYHDDKPQSAATTRDGRLVSKERFEYTDGKVRQYAVYGDYPNKEILVSEQSETTEGNLSDGCIEVSNGHAEKIVSVAVRTAANMTKATNGRTGYCAAGVYQSLVDAGVGDFPAGNATEMGAMMSRSGKFQKVSLSQVQKGDVIVRNWNPTVIAQHNGQNWGDIVIVCGKNEQGQLIGANDHQDVIPEDGGRYTNSYALRAIQS